MPKRVELCVKNKVNAGVKESIAWGTCQISYKEGKLDETGHVKKDISLGIMEEAFKKALKKGDFKMADLTTQARKNLEAGDFAFPRLKKLPLSDASHTRNAMARFNQTDGMTPEESATAIRKIIRAAHNFGIDTKGFEAQFKQSKGGEDMDRLFLQTNADFSNTDLSKDAIPVEIVRSGIATIGIDGKGAKIYISPNKLEKIKASLESSDTNKKIYWGHISSDQLKSENKIHRDLGDWIGTLDNQFRIIQKTNQEGNNYTALEGMLRVHGENEKSKTLQGLIKKEPKQIKFSLDYSGKTKIAKRNNELVHELTDVGHIRSLDFVPESGFDNGISMSAITQCITDLNFKMKEVNMTFNEWKEAHPEEFKEVSVQMSKVVKDDFDKEHKKETDELKALIAKLDSDLKQSKASNEDKKKEFNLEESDAYKKLMQSYNETAKENKELAERIKATEKENAIRTEKERMSLAHGIIQSKLEGSRVPKNLHPKVAAQLDYRAFVTDGGRFDMDSDDVVKFTQAVTDEIKDWESQLKGISIMPKIGVRDEKKNEDFTQSNPYISQLKEDLDEMKKGGND
jgi:hypothetical protein